MNNDTNPICEPCEHQLELGNKSVAVPLHTLTLLASAVVGANEIFQLLHKSQELRELRADMDAGDIADQEIAAPLKASTEHGLRRAQEALLALLVAKLELLPTQSPIIEGGGTLAAEGVVRG